MRYDDDNPREAEAFLHRDWKEGVHMTYAKLFPDHKAVIAMVHLKGDTDADVLARARKEMDLFYRNGVDAVLVENYFGNKQDCRRALNYLRDQYGGQRYGVNVLGDMACAFELAQQYGAQFIQIDSVCGHLAPGEELPFTNRLRGLREASQALVFGGVRFKYQPVRSGRTVEVDLRLGMSRCDGVVVTGEGTGKTTPTEKIRLFRKTLGTFPLITGAGVTAETVAETLAHSDGVIVGSWLKEGHNAYGEVDEGAVREFVQAAKGR